MNLKFVIANSFVAGGCFAMVFVHSAHGDGFFVLAYAICFLIVAVLAYRDVRKL